MQTITKQQIDNYATKRKAPGGMEKPTRQLKQVVKIIEEEKQGYRREMADVQSTKRHVEICEGRLHALAVLQNIIRNKLDIDI